MLPYRADLKNKARSLRKGMTDAERVLWQRLRGKQVKGHQFYRQKPTGEYVVDFYSGTARLVIEVDGGQHFHGVGAMRDRERDEFLALQGLRILRYSDHDILVRTESAMEDIWRKT